MSEEPPNFDLEQLTEETAEQIIFTLSSASDDPKQAIMRLLRRYLADAQEQEYEDMYSFSSSRLGGLLVSVAPHPFDEWPKAFGNTLVFA